MARSAWPTVSTSDSWSASQHNTYGRDNDLAYWVYTTAGDIAYATSSSALARLAIGTSGTMVLGINSGVPAWQHSPLLQGVLHTKGTVDFSPSAGSTFNGWSDITGATFNLTLTTTCTIAVFAVVSGYRDGAGNAFNVRAVVNGTADPASLFPFDAAYASSQRNEALAYIYYATGVTSGTRTVKLQQESTTTNGVYVERGRMNAFAYVE